MANTPRKSTRGTTGTRAARPGGTARKSGSGTGARATKKR